MIVGLGVDIVDISRFNLSLEKHAEAFLNKIFTLAERAEGDERRGEAQYYAGRWAVKEAVAKALGCGIGAHCHWQDINTIDNVAGRPATNLTGAAAEFAAQQGVNNIHVSISHEKNIACAMAVLEN